MRKIGHFIGGENLATSERSQPVYDPAVGTQQAEVCLASADETRKAIEAAAAAFPECAGIYSEFRQPTPTIN